MMYFKKQQGVALLEVLIAFVIVTVSVVALYQLQNKYIRNEIASSARLTALQIAESKLDDLRTFGSLTVSSGVPSYDIIGNNTGGTIASGAISSSNANVDPFVYNLSWSVTPRAGSNDVTVTVSWNDGNGPNNVKLTGSVVQTTRISADRLTNSSKAGNYKPVVKYTPVSNSDSGVVAVSLGGAYMQETTKPLPDVSSNGGGVEVKFSTVTYNTNLNTQNLSDYSTVACDCTFESGYKSTALPATLITINGLLYWSAPTTPDLKSKSWGSPSGNKNATLCSVCCENHFDNVLGGEFKDYYNRLNYPSSKYDSSLSMVTNGSYIDSCRLLRIDGMYKPMPDWNLVKLVVMDADFLKKPANLTSYQNYIKYVVKSYVELQKKDSWPEHNPSLISDSTATSIQSFSQWLTTNYSIGGDTSTSINFDLTAATNPDRQIIARGIFVDIMPDDWVDLLDTDTAGSTYLQKVPFFDINMTLISQWSSSNTAVATVASEPIQTLDLNKSYYGVYSRGYTAPISSGATVIKVTAFQGNSSVAAYQINNKSAEMPVSAYDNSKAVTDTLTLSVDGTLAPETVIASGRLYCLDQTSITTGTGNDKVTNYSATACLTNGNNKTFDLLNLSCTKSDININASPAYIPFTCTTTQGATLDISVTGIADGYSINPSNPKTVVIPENAGSAVDVGCITVYQTILNSLPGIQFDSQGCVSSN